MNKEKINKLFLIAVYIISFAFFCTIMLLSPMVNDDYSFLSYGFTNVKDIFHFALYYGNGRFLGNFTSLVLILSKPVFAIQKAVILFITVFLFAKLFKKDGDKDNSLFMFFSAFVLTIGMAPNIFAEIIPWSTCFQNYIPPITGLLICLCLIKKDGSAKYETAASVIIFIVALTSQLYLEINTVVNVLLSCLIVLIYIKTKADKSKIMKSISFAAGSVIGGAMMFMIPRIFVDPVRQKAISNYRQVHTDDLKDMLYIFYNQTTGIVREIKYCHVVLIFIALCICIIMKDSKKGKLYNHFCCTGAIAFPAYNLMVLTLAGDTLFVHEAVNVLMYFALLGYYILSLFMCILSMEKGYEKNFTLISFLFVFISAAPITIVTPVSERCYILYYLFIAACGMGFAAYLINRKKMPVNFKRMAAICFCVLCFHIGVNYYSVKVMSDIQIRCIETQLDEGKELIEVPKIPDKYYHNTAKTMWGYYYYRENQFDTKFKMVSFNKYKEILKSESK